MAEARSINRSTLFIGALVAAGGLYLMAASAGLAPLPGEPNGPVWLATCAGFAFAGAGIALVLRGVQGVPDEATDLPPDTPRWLAACYALLSVAICASLAAIGTWVAFGPGERHIMMSGIVSGEANATFGRAMFGIGAVISWLIVAAFAHLAFRKILPRKP